MSPNKNISGHISNSVPMWSNYI